MAKGKVPKPSASGVSDLDKNFISRPGHSKSRLLSGDEYTPITNLSDLGPAISAIKRSQDRTEVVVGNLDDVVREEVRPRLDEVRDGFIELKTEHRSTKLRVKSLEVDTKKLSKPKSHDCYNEDTIRGHSEEIKETQCQVADVTTKIVTMEMTKKNLGKDVKRIEDRSKFIRGTTISVIVVVLGAVASGGITLYTMQANVGHLSEEQTKIRENMAGMRKSADNASYQVQKAVTRVEKVVEKVRVNDYPDPLELIWCDLSSAERRRQERLRGSNKIPRRRCP